jgi:CTP:molybdopterin cytidylyltransferase MocA
MHSADALPVIVLGAGRGTRMGGPKALMQVGGSPWWLRQLESLTGAGLSPLWVVSPEVGAVLEADRRFLKQARVEADPDAPMFESIRAAVRFLEAAAPRAVYILPMDSPAPEPAVWMTLAAAPPAAAPIHANEHGHPVYLDWTFVRERIAGAPAGARLDQLIAPHVRYLRVDDPRVTLNLNTPDAVRAYESRFLTRES